MTTDVTYRAFQESDLTETLELFRFVFKQNIDERLYRWFFIENPYGANMIELALDGDKIVGHYAVCPSLSDVFGQEVQSVRSMTTMTHPEYSGRGIFTNLARRLYDRIRDRDRVDFVWGFPNSNSHYGFVKKLGWRDLFAMHFLDKEVAQSPARGASLQELSPQQAIAAADHPASSSTSVQLFKRDARFFRWRYLNCPHKTYRYFAPTKDSGTFAVVGSYARNGVKYLNLLDVVGNTADSALSAQLVQGVLEQAANEACDRVSLWVDLRHHLYPIAEKQGFLVRGDITYFGACPLTNSSTDLGDPRAYRVSMSDSDVF